MCGRLETRIHKSLFVPRSWIVSWLVTRSTSWYLKSTILASPVEWREAQEGSIQVSTLNRELVSSQGDTQLHCVVQLWLILAVISRTQSRKQKAESNEQGAAIGEQRAEIRGQRTESEEQQGERTGQVAEQTISSCSSSNASTNPVAWQTMLVQ